jgi:ABC-2 type transport system permease protein
VSLPAAKYLQVIKIKVQDTLEYRFDYLFGNFTHFLSLAAMLILWTAVYRGQTTELAGYTLPMMLTYFILGRAIQAMVYFTFRDEIEKEIKDGLLSKYLLRPISYLGYWFSVALAERALNFLTVTAFFFLVAWFCRGFFLFQTDPLLLLLFGLALAGAVLLNFLISFTVSLAAFWMQEIWALGFTKDMIQEFLAGGVFLLDLLPPAWYHAALWTPFAYCLYFPAQIYLGRLDGQAMASGFAMQAMFIALSFLVARAVWARGLRRYEAVGA